MTACLAGFFEYLLLATMYSWRARGCRVCALVGKTNGKLWAIQGLASTVGDGRERGGARAGPGGGRATADGPAALDRGVQRGDLPVAHQPPGPRPGLRGGLRRRAGPGRLRGGVPDHELTTPAVGPGSCCTEEG